MQLIDSLTCRPYRELRVIAGAHRLPFNNRQPKPQTIDRLRGQLADCLPRAVRRLSTAEREALRALQAAGGTLPFHRFTRRFGEIVRWRPWRDDAPRHPWRRPPNPAQSLWNLGLIYAERWGAVTLIEEAAQMLDPLPRPAPVAWTGLTDGRAGACVDVAVFLGTLLHDDVHLLHGRWLPPYALKAVNARLPLPDPTAGTARSELQTGRVRFLHYLATAAGLVAVQNGCLKPTIAGWHWLAADDASAWQTLWHAVDNDLAHKDNLWEQFRFEPVQRLDWCGFRRALARLETGQAVAHVSLVDTLRPHLPEADPVAVLGALAEPLEWLGYWRRAGEVVAVMPPVQAATDAARLLVRDAVLWLRLPSRPRRRALADLLAFAVPDGEGLRVDVDAVRRALGRGCEPVTIHETLVRLCGGTLSPEVTARLEQWTREANHVRLRHLTVIETDPATTAAIRSDWRLRPLLGDVLSPRHLAVDASETDQLCRKLARRGLPVRDDTPVTHPRRAALEIDPELAAYLWLTVRTYQKLGTITEQAVRVPSAVAGWLRESLPPAMAASLDAEAAQVVAKVSPRATQAEKIDRSTDPSHDLTRVRAALEEAARVGETLTITYTSPVYGTSQRAVSPVLLYEDGGAVYVEAWCHQQQATRTFRLDRIVNIEASTPHEIALV